MARAAEKPARVAVEARRALPVALAAAVAFLGVLLIRFPARWAAIGLPRDIRCEQLGGTLWQGSCLGLTDRGSPIGDLSWRLHPLQLLRLRLAADVALVKPNGQLSASVELIPLHRLRAHDIHASLPLDHELLAQLPPGSHGHLQADLARLDLDGKRISAVEGELLLQGVSFGAGIAPADYRLMFPPVASGDPVGQLEDLGGGPLSVRGTLRLTAEPGYVLDALVAARPGAPQELVQELRFLGSPDAQGRRPLSLAGTF